VEGSGGVLIWGSTSACGWWNSGKPQSGWLVYLLRSEDRIFDIRRGIFTTLSRVQMKQYTHSATARQ
jgi:hypothetical protein